MANLSRLRLGGAERSSGLDDRPSPNTRASPVLSSERPALSNKRIRDSQGRPTEPSDHLRSTEDVGSTPPSDHRRRCIPCILRNPLGRNPRRHEWSRAFDAIRSIGRYTCCAPRTPARGGERPPRCPQRSRSPRREADQRVRRRLPEGNRPSLSIERTRERNARRCADKQRENAERRVALIGRSATQSQPESAPGATLGAEARRLTRTAAGPQALLTSSSSLTSMPWRFAAASSFFLARDRAASLSKCV